ncbi:hypothetical protein B7939_02055 [Eggerthia catenaformis]|nr:hypothetical protein B7939_02055 [Eggerthia catenaformis]
MDNKKQEYRQIIITFPAGAVDITHLEPVRKFENGHLVKDSSGKPVNRLNRDGSIMQSVWVRLPSPKERDDDFAMPEDSNGINRMERGAHIKVPVTMIHTSKYNQNQKYAYFSEDYSPTIYIHGHSNKEGVYDKPDKYVCRNAHELASAFGMKKKQEKAKEYEKKKQNIDTIDLLNTDSILVGSFDVPEDEDEMEL